MYDPQVFHYIDNVLCIHTPYKPLTIHLPKLFYLTAFHYMIIWPLFWHCVNQPIVSTCIWWYLIYTNKWYHFITCTFYMYPYIYIYTYTCTIYNIYIYIYIHHKIPSSNTGILGWFWYLSTQIMYCKIVEPIKWRTLPSGKLTVCHGKSPRESLSQRNLRCYNVGPPLAPCQLVEINPSS